ncbi:MAG: hypothetical protein WA771_02825 [Chthoniobacterales bacterium]
MKFLFDHVPKTAGTSLRVWMEQFFPEQDVYPGHHFEAEVGIPDPEWERWRFFAAHHAWRKGADEEEVRVTWLRDPESLIRSVYRYQIEQLAVEQSEAAIPKIAGYPDYEAGLRTGMAFEDFLQRVASGGVGFHSYQCRWMNADRGAMGATFGGGQRSKLLDRAKAKVAACRVAGLVERFQESVDLLNYRMGWPPVRFGFELNRSGSDRVQASDEAWEMFRKDNEDFELWNFADGLLSERMAAMDAELGCGEGERHGRMLDRFLAQGDPTLTETMWNRGEVIYGDGWGPRVQVGRPDEPVIRWLGAGGRGDAFFPAVAEGWSELSFRVVRNRGHGVMRGLWVEIDGKKVECATRASTSEGYPRATSFRVRLPKPAGGERYRMIRLGVPEAARDAILATGERTVLATDGIRLV